MERMFPWSELSVFQLKTPLSSHEKQVVVTICGMSNEYVWAMT